MNLLSACCHKEIIVRHGVDCPLGGTFGKPYKYDACIGCGQECSPVEACEHCGTVGCRYECLGLDEMANLN